MCNFQLTQWLHCGPAASAAFYKQANLFIVRPQQTLICLQTAG